MNLCVSAEDITAPPNPASDGLLRFNIAGMVSAEATFSTYRRLVERISRDAGLEDSLVLRRTHAEVRQNLSGQRVQVAFVCTWTYLHASREKSIRLLVQPEFEKGLEYRCLLIVPSESPSRKIEDLRGQTMAFTDPESNTGYMVPTVMLFDRGGTPGSFFGKTVFTGSHDNSILAVLLGAVDVASVDALVWKSHLREQPSLASRVRIIWKSEEFGAPPVVVPVGLDARLEQPLRQAFLRLHEDGEGREILSGIGIERFVPGREEDYRSALDIYAS